MAKYLSGDGGTAAGGGGPNANDDDDDPVLPPPLPYVPVTTNRGAPAPTFAAGAHGRGGAARGNASRGGGNAGAATGWGGRPAFAPRAATNNVGNRGGGGGPGAPVKDDVVCYRCQQVQTACVTFFCMRSPSANISKRLWSGHDDSLATMRTHARMGQPAVHGAAGPPAGPPAAGAVAMRGAAALERVAVRPQGRAAAASEAQPAKRAPEVAAAAAGAARHGAVRQPVATAARSPTVTAAAAADGTTRINTTVATWTPLRRTTRVM